MIRKHIGSCCLAAFGLFAAIASVPADAAPGEVSFLVIGDWGTGSDDQHKVAREMAAAAREIGARFVISTGDNLYPQGLKSAGDPQFQAKFENVYGDAALMVPWYAVLGNHDHQGDASAEIGHASANDRWRLPSAYYKQSETLEDGSAAEFFFIDTEAIRKRYQNWVSRLTRDPQVGWLERELAGSKAAWKIVVGHHPVYAAGAHPGEPALIRQLEPLFEKYGVQVYLNGHNHHMEHLIAGGTHYLTSGAAARTRPGTASAGTQFISSERTGFMTARLRPAALDIEFLDDQGASLYRSRIPRNINARGAPAH